MKVILDTNVFVSGVFFSGTPHDILRAWHEKKIHLIVSPEILDEYRRVGKELAAKFRGVEFTPFLELLALEAESVNAPSLPHPVCDDKDDDKFLACALASRTKIIISGDKALLKTSGYRHIQVLTPRNFADKFLPRKKP